MLRRLYRCALRLHPSSFRRRFGDEMLYIFDQQKGTLALLRVMLDCVFSVFRQWTLRPRVPIVLRAAPLRSPMPDHIPLFESLDPFRPRASAMIHGALLSLILLYTTITVVPYSWIHVLNLRIPEAGIPTEHLSGDSKKLSAQLQVEVIPTEADNHQSTIAASGTHTPATPVPRRGVMISLDPYIGEYISTNPPAKISIQYEGDYLNGHLSLSWAAAGHPSFALSPVSPAKFVVVGTENSYVDFTADVQGRVRSLSLVVDGKVITAQRQ
jgi:hypothetical protein